MIEQIGRWHTPFFNPSHFLSNIFFFCNSSKKKYILNVRVNTDDLNLAATSTRDQDRIRKKKLFTLAIRAREIQNGETCYNVNSRIISPEFHYSLILEWFFYPHCRRPLRSPRDCSSSRPASAARSTISERSRPCRGSRKAAVEDTAANRKQINRQAQVHSVGFVVSFLVIVSRVRIPTPREVSSARPNERPREKKLPAASPARENVSLRALDK